MRKSVFIKFGLLNGRNQNGFPTLSRINDPGCPYVASSEKAYGARNINPEDVPGSYVLIVTFIGCRFGSLTKLQTCGELVIGLGVVWPVFDRYGTVPHRGDAARAGAPPRLQASIAAIGVDTRRPILVKSLL
jgi:hypothetical protein